MESPGKILQPKVLDLCLPSEIKTINLSFFLGKIIFHPQQRHQDVITQDLNWLWQSKPQGNHFKLIFRTGSYPYQPREGSLF